MNDALSGAELTLIHDLLQDHARIESPAAHWEGCHLAGGHLRCLVWRLYHEVVALRGAIVTHHGQKADDRCVEDDDRLYAAAGLPPCDRRVGNKAEMLLNCARFIDRRCEAGGWPTYRELEEENERLRNALRRST